ncbi:MAG: PAS domain S-box protein [Lentimicrobiaceae bacterium]|nr:PAS domain S-box protein [Lentimicrobiaceae bacterium]MDD4599405.1 PAS domain S-box protein [Lentimicrobiaceae bacterium]
MNNEELDFSNAEILRKSAEEQLKSNQGFNSLAEELTDLKKLLHELQVHQIELELQNDALRQANTAAELALKKYTLLFDLAPIGYFTLDSGGAILELNFTGARMLGERRFSLINSNFKLFVSDESRQVFNEFFKRVNSSNAKESCEVMLGHNNKTLCAVYMEGVITEDDQNCLLSVVDISRFQPPK